MKVTVDICTRERYNILCDTLYAILNQTFLPDEIIIYDDSYPEFRQDLRRFSIYNHLFHEFDRKKIKWKVGFGNGNGQVAGHQWIKDNAENDWIWRIDDDEIPENNVLQGLVDTIQNERDIVSCLIPHFLMSDNAYNGSNLIDNYKRYNSQWVYGNRGKIDHCEHLYSSFLYNRKCTIGYSMELSPVGHGEETIFTYRNFKHGCNLKVNRDFIIWHKRYGSGGIRSVNDENDFKRDEIVTSRIIENLKKWKGEKIFPVWGGIGDNYSFRSSFGNDIDNLKKRHGNILIATSHEDVYDDMDVEVISIQKAGDILSERVVNNYNVYGFMTRNNWNRSIIEAYKKLFGFDGEVEDESN